MKKSLKTLLAMVAVLVVLGGVAVALWITAPETEEVVSEVSSSTPAEMIIDREAADVASISVECDAGDLTLVPVEEGTETSASSQAESESSSSEVTTQSVDFTVEGYEDYDIVTSRVNTSVNSVVGLSATRNLGPQDNLEDFGLTDGGMATVTVTYKDGSSDQLVLGDEAGESLGNYLLKDGTVYVASLPSQLYNGPFTYFNTEVYTVADRVADTVSSGDSSASSSQETLSDQLTWVRLSGSDFPQTIVIEQNPDKISGYLVTSPVTAESGTTAFTEMVTALKSLSATRVVAAGLTQEKLEQYGLAQPAAQIEFTMNGETHTLAASAPDEEGSRYLVADDLDVVFQLSDSDVSTWADASLMTLRMSYVILPNIQNVEKLTLTVEGDMVYSYDVTKVLNEEKSTESVPAYDLEIKNAAGEAIDYEVYQDYYQELIALAVLSEEEAPHSDSPTLRVEYQYFDNGGSDVVELYAVDGQDRFTALLNGEFNGLVRKDSVESLIAGLPDLDANVGAETEASASSAESEAEVSSETSSETE